MPSPVDDTVEAEVVSVPSHEDINEKIHLAVDDEKSGKHGALDTEIKAVPPPLYDSENHDKDSDSDDVIIITGADAAAHLLPLRDDGEPALTFRSLFLATGLSGFQAVMTQIYNVSCIWFQWSSCPTWADPPSSSNRLQWTFRGLLSSSSPTFWAKHGPPFCPAAIDTRLDGGRKVVWANLPDGSGSSPFSTLGPGT